MVGQLIEGQRQRAGQMDRIEERLDCIQADQKEASLAHAALREMVLSHRTGWKLLVWLGGAAIMVLSLLKGVVIWRE